MNNEFVLAPTEELVRYLSILRRSFACIHAWGTTGNRDGMLFGGWLADALHNVPDMLLHETRYTYPSPKSIGDWLDRGFPAMMRHHFAAPEHLLSAYEAILSPENAASELGIEDGIDIAPIDGMQRYLALFYDAFLEIRDMRRYGSKPTPWPILPQKWSAEADEDGLKYADVAGLLESVPAGLLRWGDFDEVRFLRAAREGEGIYSERYLTHWQSRFGITPAS